MLKQLEIMMMKKILTLMVLAMGLTLGTVTMAAMQDKDIKVVVDMPCDAEDMIDNYWSTSPLLCTNGKWRNAIVTNASSEESKTFVYNGKCTLRLSAKKHSDIVASVQVGKPIEICLPTGWKSHIIAIAESDDFYIAQPRLISNLVFLKATKRTSSRVWIYPVNHDGITEEKFEITVVAVD